jgi:hypothetical protein
LFGILYSVNHKRSRIAPLRCHTSLLSLNLRAG